MLESRQKIRKEEDKTTLTRNRQQDVRKADATLESKEGSLERMQRAHDADKPKPPADGAAPPDGRCNPRQLIFLQLILMLYGVQNRREARVHPGTVRASQQDFLGAAAGRRGFFGSLWRPRSSKCPCKRRFARAVGVSECQKDIGTGML